MSTQELLIEARQVLSEAKQLICEVEEQEKTFKSKYQALYAFTLAWLFASVGNLILILI